MEEDGGVKERDVSCLPSSSSFLTDATRADDGALVSFRPSGTSREFLHFYCLDVFYNVFKK